MSALRPNVSFVSAPALVLWLLEGEGNKALLFPFRLPHLEFLQRCQQALHKTECWVPCPRTAPTRRAIAHLTRLLNRLERDTRFAIMAARVEKAWQAFCELRDVLQLTNAELPKGDPRPHRIGSSKRQTAEIASKLMIRRYFRDSESFFLVTTEVPRFGSVSGSVIWAASSHFRSVGRGVGTR